MTLFRAVLITVLFTFLGQKLAYGQDVTLRSRDGAIELSGTLQGFDGDFYRLDTEFGELTVDGSSVLCEGPGCPSLIDYVAEVTIVGSASLGNTLLPALLEGFAARVGYRTQMIPTTPQSFTYEIIDPAHAKTVGRFYFNLSTTDKGFDELLEGEADIVLALREIRPSEVARAKEDGLGVMTAQNRSRVIGLDAMVPIVSLVNPVESLSMTDLSQLLSGEITNWHDLGGPDADITLHLLTRENGLTQGIEDKLLRPMQTTFGGDIVWHASNADLIHDVARDSLGVGLASISEIGNSKTLEITGPCGFKLGAARRTIKTEDYPLTAPMFLYMPARRLPALVRDFLSFTRSLSAQIVIRRAGFVDQSPEEVSLDLQGNRFTNAISVADGATGLRILQDMTGFLRGLQRLTTSFRFEPGSANLDAQSRSNVRQLARSIETGQYDGRSLYFIGFSDGQGPSVGNQEISARRAITVRDAVLEQAEAARLDRIQIETTAFGEALPMACDDTEWGRQVNRRVEVWVK